MKTTQNSQSLTSFTHVYQEKIDTQFKFKRLDSANYLNVDDRSLERLLERAYDGFIWLLERKRKYYCYNAIPKSEAFIGVNEWREEIAKVIILNEAEIQIIQNLLITDNRLIYRDSSQILLMTSTQNQELFLLDDNTGKAFNNWLDMA